MHRLTQVGIPGEAMPNRIVRESILDSPRYWSVDEGAELLYMHLLLLADDFGCLSIEFGFIGRRCFMHRPTDARLENLIKQLAGADLIRPYRHRDLHYAFIPRFRQRLKRETLKNPQPPDELLVDDHDAQEKFQRLNGHTRNPAAGGLPSGGPPASSRAGGREVEVKEVNRSAFDVDGKAALATDRRSAVDRAAELAEKMRLKKN